MSNYYDTLDYHQLSNSTTTPAITSTNTISDEPYSKSALSGSISSELELSSGHVNLLLQQISQRNHIPIHELKTFIQTMRTDEVVMHRQQLANRELLPNQWITIQVVLPNGLTRNVDLLASIFNYSIAGQLTFDCLTYESSGLINALSHYQISRPENSTTTSVINPTIRRASSHYQISSPENSTTTSVIKPKTWRRYATWKIVSIILVIIIMAVVISVETTLLILRDVNGGSSIENNNASTTTTTTIIPTTMTDCYDWRLNGSTSNGIYRINPGYGLELFNVYCDMTTDGGGWTVIQRRVDDSLEFWNNTWQQYKVGFSNGIDRNLWLGNDRIHVMSSQWNVTLRVEIKGERWLNTNPNFYLYGKYNFSISDEIHNYTLQISLPIEGNASDANPTYGSIYNNGQPFSTVDKSSNEHGSECANIRQYGGWWFNVECTDVAFNGKYNPLPGYGFRWYSPATLHIVPDRSEMKIRRQ